MDFSTLRTEVQAAGFDDWTAGADLTRLKRVVNESYKAICDSAPWGFLETTASGAAPLTIADIAHIFTVTDNTSNTNLTYMPKDVLERSFPDTPDTGTPSYWYWASDTSIGVYPTSTTTIEVFYAKYPADLSADGDTPVVPTRYHGLIVLGATIRAWRYKDASGTEALQALKREYQEELGQMMSALLVRQSEPEFILPSGWD
jgi:hypothetical protein